MNLTGDLFADASQVAVPAAAARCKRPRSSQKPKQTRKAEAPPIAWPAVPIVPPVPAVMRAALEDAVLKARVSELEQRAGPLAPEQKSAIYWLRRLAEAGCDPQRRAECRANIVRCMVALDHIGVVPR